MKNENLKLAGTKLYLRYPKLEDCAEFIALAGSSQKFHRKLVNPAKDEESFRRYVERSMAKENEFLLICRYKDEKIAGAVNLSQIFRLGFQNCYLGYYLFKDFVGEGLMTEAVGLILRHAFKNLKLRRVEANFQPENKSSIAVLQKNGFTKEGFSRKYLKVGGRWRDHERWAIIREDWSNK
ncbi:MAG: GNAT family protein [Actinomycetota bacterium]